MRPPVKSIRKPPERVVPASVEAEAALLGCCLLSPENTLADVMARCPSPSVFWDIRHQVLYDVLLAMHERSEPIDTVTVYKRLTEGGVMSAAGGLEYVSVLPDKTPSPANFSHYLGIVLEKYEARRVIELCEAALNNVYGGTDGTTASASLERDLLKLHGRNGLCDWGLKQAIKGAVADLDAARTRQGEITGLTTGLIDLDKTTGGLQPDQMIVLAGRPGTGKSSIALNIADHLAVTLKHSVGYFSFEMSKKALMNRAIGARAGVNMRYARQGMYSDMEAERMNAASGKLAMAPLYMDDQPQQNIAQIRSKARRMVQKHGIVALILDYLQLLHGYPECRYRSEQEELTDISSAIKELAMELHIPIIVLSALNREIEREKKPRRPRMSDLKGCGSIESDADVIGILYRADKEDRRQPAEEGEYYGEHTVPVNLLICKQRDGWTGDLHMTFLASITKFECAARIANDQQTEMAYGTHNDP